MSHVNIIADLENRILDHRFSNWSGDMKPDSNIVIISIDDGSLDFFAQNGISWPWPRSFYAHLVQYLSEAEIQGVVFDMLFTHSDADRSETDAEETDGTFANSLVNNGKNVLGMIIEGSEFKNTSSLLNFDELIPTDRKSLARDSLIELPIPVLRDAATKLGHTNISPDRDGIFRHVKPFVQINGYALPS